MVEQEMPVEMFSIWKKFTWPAVQKSINGVVGSHNGQSDKARYGWRRWEQWCMAFDIEAGQIIGYVDGDEDGFSLANADEQFLNPLKEANKKIKEENVVTDVLVGCALTEDVACK